MTNIKTGSLTLRTTDAGLVKTTSTQNISQKFQSALNQVSKRAQGAAGTVAPFIPGGPILSAAVNSLSTSAQIAMATNLRGVGPFGGPAGGVGFSDPAVLAAYGGAFGLGGMGGGGEMGQMLLLQRQISIESQQFSMISNVMRARHDAAMTAVNNIR